MGDWKIEILDRPAQFLTDIWIYRRGPNGGTIFYSFKGNDVVEEVEHKGGSAPFPATLTIPCDLKSLLLEALLSKGVKSPDKSFVEGKLEATEEHLADLRHILKLPIEYVVNKKA